LDSELDDERSMYKPCEADKLVHLTISQQICCTLRFWHGSDAFSFGMITTRLQEVQFSSNIHERFIVPEFDCFLFINSSLLFFFKKIFYVTKTYPSTLKIESIC